MSVRSTSEPSSAESRPPPPPPTTTNGFRRWFVLLGFVVLVAGLGALGIGQVALQADAARREVELRLSELTGLPVTARAGGAEFHLLPVARLSLADVRIGGADAVLTIDRLTADLGVWQALLGRTEIERLVLERPELLSSEAFVADASGEATRRRTPDAAYAAFSGGFGELMSRFGSLTSIEIRNGVFRMGPSPASRGVRDAHVVLSWPAPGSAAAMSGTYVWNGQPSEIAVTVAAPLAFLDGGRSAVDLRLVSPALTLGFTGEGAIGAAARLAGRLEVEVPSLGRAVRWLGGTGTAAPELGPLAVNADLDAANGLLALTNARVTLDGSLGQGALDLQFSGQRPNLAGTLAFDTLDLRGLAGALAPLPRRPLDFARRIDLGFVDRLDMDLRVSAAAAAVAEIPVEDLAATVKFKDGTATLDIGDATLLGGQGQMRMSIAAREPVPLMKGFLSLKGVDVARFLPALGVRAPSFAGAADMSAEIETPVVDWATVLDRNRFNATLAMRGGTLFGVDPALFETLGTRRFALDGSSAVSFEGVQATIEGRGTEVELHRLHVAGEAGILSAAGRLSTASSEVDIAGRFAFAGSDTQDALTSRQPIGFTMRGRWPSPEIATAPATEPM